MKTLYFILMALLLLSIIGMLSNNEKLCHFSCELHKSVITAFCVCCIIGLINWNTPSAINVYQGKTTLEITYREGVAIDSIVVFKKGKKNETNKTKSRILETGKYEGAH